MSTSSRDDEKDRTDSADGLPTLEELEAMYTEDQLVYGIHILLEGGEEQCLVDAATSSVQPDSPPARHDRADESSPGN